jgi:hypothetical protein
MSGSGGIVSNATQGITKSLKDPLTLLNPATMLQGSALTGQSASEMINGPDMPTPAQPVTAPTNVDAQNTAAETIRRRLMAKGRSSTFLTGGSGVTESTGSIGKKTLLGQ